jgi:DNA-binding transcriptional regulator YiaG
MMSEPTAPATPVKPAGKPFPRFCDRCRKWTVWPATIAYDHQIRLEGQLHHVYTPQLVVPRCQECGELFFDNDTEKQVSQAVRTQLHLLLPEQIRANRESLGPSLAELADKLGVTAEVLGDWEEGLVYQPRALDNLLRVYFALPAVRSVLRGPDQSPVLGAVVGTTT